MCICIYLFTSINGTRIKVTLKYFCLCQHACVDFTGEQHINHISTNHLTIYSNNVVEGLRATIVEYA